MGEFLEKIRGYAPAIYLLFFVGGFFIVMASEAYWCLFSLPLWGLAGALLTWCLVTKNCNGYKKQLEAANETLVDNYKELDMLKNNLIESEKLYSSQLDSTIKYYEGILKKEVSVGPAEKKKKATKA